MTRYIIDGNSVNVTTDKALDVRSSLPVGTYTVKVNPMSGAFYLDMIDNFHLSGKLYGDVEQRADRIFRTFGDRKNSTGVLLTGEKGSGKTMLAKVLSMKGIDRGVSTIVVNSALYGDGFNTFMQSIEQETIILFDEFEKVYDRDQQERMLTLLDGVYPSKKMFILTCNDKYRIDAHMVNRPGRIFYRMEYKGLDPDFIREYARDNLNDQAQVEPLMHLTVAFDKFNFDMLKAIVEEMNRYDETPKEAIAMLNATPEEGTTIHDAVLFINGKEVDLHDKYVSANPSVESFDVSWRLRAEGHKTRPVRTDFENESDFLDARFDYEAQALPRWETLEFSPDMIASVDTNEASWVFVHENGARLTLTRRKATERHWAAY